MATIHPGLFMANCWATKCWFHGFLAYDLICKLQASIESIHMSSLSCKKTCAHTCTLHRFHKQRLCSGVQPGAKNTQTHLTVGCFSRSPTQPTIYTMQKNNIIYMVGGFNPSKKYLSNGIMVPNTVYGKKCSKPPTR